MRQEQKGEDKYEYELVHETGTYFAWVWRRDGYYLSCVEWVHARGEYYVTDCSTLQDPPYNYIAGPFDSKEAAKAAYLMLDTDH